MYKSFVFHQDPQEIMNEEKTSECSKYKTELDTCTERVTSKSRTTETCEQELYDFLHCRDVKVSLQTDRHVFDADTVLGVNAFKKYKLLLLKCEGSNDSIARVIHTKCLSPEPKTPSTKHMLETK